MAINDPVLFGKVRILHGIAYDFLQRALHHPKRQLMQVDVERALLHRGTYDIANMV